MWSLHPEFMHREITSMRNEDFVCWATKQTPGALRTGWLVQARGKKQDFQTCKLWKSEGRSRRWGTQGRPCAHDVRSADAKSWETRLGWCWAATLGRDLSISRTQKDKAPLQFAAGAFIAIQELTRVFRAAALDSLHWWYLHLLVFVDCRALNNSGWQKH